PIMFVLYLAAIVLASTNSVSAALYPTRPVASTVFTTGQSEDVTWRDDRMKPHLWDLGPMDIDLFTGDTAVRLFFVYVSCGVSGLLLSSDARPLRYSRIFTSVYRSMLHLWRRTLNLPNYNRQS